MGDNKMKLDRIKSFVKKYAGEEISKRLSVNIDFLVV